MAAQTDILDQLKAWIRTGVSPLGAQVLRIEGRWETPLSSWKKIQAFCRRAFFLTSARFPSATDSPSADCTPGLGWPAFVRSIAWPSESSTHDRDDSGRPSVARSLSPLGAASINRWQNPAPALLRAAPGRVAPIVRAGAAVFVPRDRLPVEPRHRLVSTRHTSDLHFAGWLSVLVRSPPGIVCPPRSTAPLVCVVVLMPENHVVAELSCSSPQ